MPCAQLEIDEDGDRDREDEEADKLGGREIGGPEISSDIVPPEDLIDKTQHRVYQCEAPKCLAIEALSFPEVKEEDEKENETLQGLIQLDGMERQGSIT